jgi:hypothetical protein
MGRGVLEPRAGSADHRLLERGQHVLAGESTLDERDSPPAKQSIARLCAAGRSVVECNVRANEPARRLVSGTCGENMLRRVKGLRRDEAWRGNAATIAEASDNL